MAGEEDSSDSASVGSALEEVLKDKGRAAAPVRQRLRTASRVLKQQSASDAAALLCDTEAIDSAVTAQDAGGFPDWLIELSVQLLTVVAVCVLACAGGIIVGTVMSRGTLSTGGHVVEIEKYGNASLGFEFLEPSASSSASSTRGGEDENQATSVLRSQFILKLPAYSSSETGGEEKSLWLLLPPRFLLVEASHGVCNDAVFADAYIEALSGLATLTYVPATHLPAADKCFGNFAEADTKWGLALQTLTPEEEERRKSLLSRGRENLSLVRPLGVEVVNLPSSSSNSEEDKESREELTQEMKKSLLHRDERMLKLLTYSLADVSPEVAVSPFPLVATPVPFAAGIVPGLTRLNFYVGLNLPLVAQDAAAATSLRQDCEKGRLYIQLSVVGAAATSMFFRQPHLPVRAAPFPVACSIRTVPQNQWPPAADPSFAEEAQIQEIDSEILLSQDVQTA